MKAGDQVVVTLPDGTKHLGTFMTYNDNDCLVILAETGGQEWYPESWVSAA